MLKKLLIIYGSLLGLYSIFSYALTDPNLVITSWPPYWQFQQWMWQTFFHHRELLTYSYGTLVTLLTLVYLLILRRLAHQPARSVQKNHLVLYLTLILPLLVSYNALSHDVFNYMFNAKIVMEYQANPHVQVALNFPQDEWVRFMHNTHTPAPYGVGWTAFSLLPFVLGLGKFVTTWLAFRLLSLVSLGLLWLAISRIAQFRHQPLTLFQAALLFLNPLLIIEVISNSHNDLWMMIPALISLALVTTPAPVAASNRWLKLLLAGVLLGISASVKFATLLLLPLWLLAVVINYLPGKPLRELFSELKLRRHWPLLASVGLFLPLLTPRSQLFHPWYLIWVLVWLPLFKLSSAWQKWWTVAVVALSISSLWRYLPWLWSGGFEGDVFLHQKLVTWVGGGSLVLLALLFIKKR